MRRIRENSIALRKRGRSVFAAFLLFLLLSFICGCGSAQEQTGASRGSAPAGGVSLYYLDKDATTIVAAPWEGGADPSPDEILTALASSSDPVDLKAPLEGIAIEEKNLSDGILTISFSGEYKEADPVLQILIRAAVVNSVCQLDEISSVAFLCEGEPLTDASGNALGNLSASSFIFNAGSEISNYERVRLHLYFANKDGDKLVDTYRNAVYNSNVSMERLVVEEVLKGPNSSQVYPTLNSETGIISVTSRDGVCYVNLDDAFLTEPYNITPQAAVYSLVNSLTELSGVRKVQISVDGNTNVSFMETVSLQTVFERSLSMVEGSETEE